MIDSRLKWISTTFPPWNSTSKIVLKSCNYDNFRGRRNLNRLPSGKRKKWPAVTFWPLLEQIWRQKCPKDIVEIEPVTVPKIDRFLEPKMSQKSSKTAIFFDTFITTLNFLEMVAVMRELIFESRKWSTKTCEHRLFWRSQKGTQNWTFFAHFLSSQISCFQTYLLSILTTIG